MSTLIYVMWLGANDNNEATLEMDEFGSEQEAADFIKAELISDDLQASAKIIRGEELVPELKLVLHERYQNKGNNHDKEDPDTNKQSD